MPFVRNTLKTRIKLKPLSCTVSHMSPSTAGKLKTLLLSYFAYSHFLVLSYSLDRLNNFPMLSTLFTWELRRYLSKAFWLQLSWTKTHFQILISLWTFYSYVSDPYLLSVLDIFNSKLENTPLQQTPVPLLTEEQTSSASPGHGEPS